MTTPMLLAFDEWQRNTPHKLPKHFADTPPPPVQPNLPEHTIAVHNRPERVQKEQA